MSGKVLVNSSPAPRGSSPLDHDAGDPARLDRRHPRRPRDHRAQGRQHRHDFYDGLFKLTQSKGVKTILTLTEQLAPCPKKKKTSASAAAKKPKTRKLWGSGSGASRPRGQYSAATVRGTQWLVQDSCAGTLTRVTKGIVSVRDNVKKKTVAAAQGQDLHGQT